VRRPDRQGDRVGTAVPRQSSGRPGEGGAVILVPGGYGYYPWGYGGLGFGGYYGGYYDPFDPYPGGGYPTYYPPQQRDAEGGVRIKVKPREASVYVDGYYVGHVDDFDGLLQKLQLSEGPHRIELREPKYESLVFDVRIDTDQTITYHGEMKKIG
jgi:PEGA domain